MVKLSSDSLALLYYMFPGNEIVPGFLDLDKKEELATSIRNIKEASSIYFIVHEQNPGLDINGILKLMKKDKKIDMTVFLDSALEVYFSSPEVVRSITRSPVPLFPNERVLPDFNYDLLEPVYMRMVSKKNENE
jgi:hypothetical protein